MARLSRLAIAGHLHHVVQRGHNDTDIFIDDTDRQSLAQITAAAARQFGVAIHAWVWLPNSFHLLATPGTDEALPRMMQAVGRDYVRIFNKRHSRSGTLWSGRYRCSVLEAETYALPCMVFMDRLPVQIGLVESAADHLWSSHRQLAGVQRSGPLIGLSPHPLMWRLGNTPFAREEAYRGLVEDGRGEVDRQLADAAKGGWALGSDAFLDQIQGLSKRRVSKGRAGRPSAGKSKSASTDTVPTGVDQHAGRQPSGSDT